MHGAVFKSFGAVRHRRLGTVHARLALWMFAGSAPLSLVGDWVGTQLGKHSQDLQSASSAGRYRRRARLPR